MRLRARVDRNQAEIVEALEQVNATVLHLHQVGKGCPDILVGYRGRNYLIEIKAPGHGTDLTEDELAFHISWSGQVDVATSPEEALRVIGAGC
jgi:hypothetical protein